MSLAGNLGLDLTSWVRSLRASLRVIMVCLVDFLLAWLVFWQLATSLNKNGAIALYSLVRSDTAILILGGIATLGDVIWVPLVFYQCLPEGPLRLDKLTCAGRRYGVG